MCCRSFARVTPLATGILGGDPARVIADHSTLEVDTAINPFHLGFKLQDLCDRQDPLSFIRRSLSLESTNQLVRLHSTILICAHRESTESKLHSTTFRISHRFALVTHQTPWCLSLYRFRDRTGSMLHLHSVHPFSKYRVSETVRGHCSAVY